MEQSHKHQKNELISNQINSNQINLLSETSIPIKVEDMKKLMSEFIEFSGLVDKKCIELHELNSNHNEKICQYKTMMENIIIKYHDICKELFKKT